MTQTPRAQWMTGALSKELVNSWDLFDTLMTRFCLDPKDTFRLIDARHPEYGFFARRTRAQTALDKIGKPYVIHDIYRQMILEGLPEAEAWKLLRQELRAEHDLLFPVRSNIERVADDDIIVTDMYLSDQIIADFVWKICGLKTLKPAVRSNWGKATGSIWPALLKHYVIRKHHGDNPRSDVEIPRRYGIPAELIDNTRLTAWEKKISSLGQPHLALLLRETRLRGLPANAKPLLEFIAGPYLTLLYAYALWLDLSFGKRNVQFVFLRRDCEDLSRIFLSMFPDAEIKQIDLNRHIASVDDPDFNAVLGAQITPNSLLIDMVATGRSVFRFIDNTNTPFFGFVSLIYLDALLREHETALRDTDIDKGRFSFFIRQSELAKHHYPLECLLQTDYPPVISLGHDARSGGIIRRHGKSDLSHEERQLVKTKNVLLQEFMDCLRRRNHEACDITAAALLVKESVNEILNAREIPNSFPSFLAREKNN